MPAPDDPSGPPGRLSRRTALAAAVGVTALTAGCKLHGIDIRSDRTPHPTPSPTPDLAPDVLVAATVLDHEQAVLDRIDATVAAHPRLVDRLASARAGHRAHVQLLTKAVPTPARPGASPSASPSPSPTSILTPPLSATPSASPSAYASPTAVPHDPHKALRSLGRLEEQLAMDDKRSAFAAQSGSFARVLASMGAAAAQQSAVLAGRDRS
ncbi:MAG TPA: hypothetical protein VFJ19_08130 [Nocardioidaceae bacterium]|nr:hypothetical protein [Nocardioidaceae bacterium]